jgi:hypothetical protein
MKITMASSNHKAENEFSFKKDTVFAAICKAVSNIDRMKISSPDKLTGRIVLSGRIMVKRTEKPYIRFQLPLII